MKRVLLILSYLLGASSVLCSAQPPIPTTQESLSTNNPIHHIAPTIKVYIENSGSMYGYVKGATEFENAVYSFLSDIQLAELGDKNGISNEMELNYINSQLIRRPADLQAYIKALEPTNFQMLGGNLGTTDLASIIGRILSRNTRNDIAVFVSDCIFSPGRTNNADEFIKAQSIEVKRHFVEKKKSEPDFSVVVLRLLSQFNGTYYNKHDDPSIYNGQRPFFIWLMGDSSLLKRILQEVKLSEIKGSGVHNIYMASSTNQRISYAILPASIGRYTFAPQSPKTSITNTRLDNKNPSCRLLVSVGVDFSHLLLPDEYLLDPNNYTVSNKAYSIEIVKNSNSNLNYTHIIKLKLAQPTISRGALTITVNNNLPTWVAEHSDSIGLNINDDGAELKTYGLAPLMEGVFDAYKSQNYGEIFININ